MQSYILDFKKSPSFLRKWNKEFDVEDIENSTFYITLVDDICEDNIEDCLNNSNQLVYSGSHIRRQTCSLSYNESEDYITSKITLNGEVTFDLTGVHFSMKGIFITANNGYVLGYTINPSSVNITSSLVLEDGLELWTIVEGAVND